MASFWFLLLLIFMALPLLSLASSSSQLISDIPKIPSSPTSMSDPPVSPFEELSPDIAPLLPSPGGVVPAAGSSMPTIPSSLSPPNPDDLMGAGPGSVLPPLGFPASSSTSLRISLGSINLAAFSAFVAYCSIQLVRVP